MPTISLTGVAKSYGGKGPNAVADLDLEIGHGEFMCLLGPSGCGKTTTLRMIAGLENLSAGEISVGGRTLDSINAGVFVPPEKRGMGLVFQSYALWPHLTVERNTDFGLRLAKLPPAEREARVTKVMHALGIEQYRDRYPSQLSGGQQQRVALARMLAVNPQVLLLDEPLSNLDARLRLEMRAELKRIHEEFQTTIVFVTHDQWEAMTLATRIAVMKDGRLQQVGVPDEIYGRPANRFVAEFVGAPPINILERPASIAANVLGWLGGRISNPETIASIGIRPESISTATDPHAFRSASTIAGVLPTGGSWIVEHIVEGQKLFQMAHEPPRLKAGDESCITVRPDALHLFAANGERIHPADAELRQLAELQST